VRILGIDPGTRVTGYGIIEKVGNRLIHVDNGGIFTRADMELADRLKLIYDGLCRIIREYEPGAVAVEQIFLAKNALSALKLGHARGAALLSGVNHGLPVFEYSALQVKSAVVGYGKAEIAQEDASDALAVAICHAHTNVLHSERMLKSAISSRRS
jgi:crossover junction endodeoxyribonuclease RuvC